MSTHFFHSAMVGAPTNTNAAGSTLAIIDACLNTGFNVAAPLSASVASEVMTLAYSAAHGYEDKVWIRLDGAPGGSITQRATVTSTTVLTIPAPGFADGPVSGSLSTRVAPADWEKVFVGTGKAVFRSKVEGPGSTRFFYRVSDAVLGLSARLRGFESMTDVDTGIGPFPTITQSAGDGVQLYRSDSAAPRHWAVVCDERTIYAAFSRDSGTSSQQCFGFGDLMPFGESDLFCAGLFAGFGNQLSGSTGSYLARAYSGSGGSISCNKISIFGTSGETGRVYPSPVDGGMIFHRPVLLVDGVSTAFPLRGWFRGLMHCSANPVTAALWRVFEFDAVDGIDGRLVVLRDGGGSCVAFPLDEGWS